MEWDKIMEIAELALKNGRDIEIELQSDGLSSINVTTPQDQIIETTTRSRWVLDKDGGLSASEGGIL